jgi:hypothetical protein
MSSPTLSSESFSAPGTPRTLTIARIVTWNDYAESHYLGTVNTNVFMDSDAHAYVDGMTHTAWQIPAKHYISWYLNGAEPAVTVRPRRASPLAAWRR